MLDISKEGKFKENLMEALHSKRIYNHRRVLFSLLLCFMTFSFLLGCPGPEPGEGGLRFCHQDSDCPQNDTKKLVCVWNLCQIKTECEKKEEACNGRDDDCDGKVDNGNPGGGKECVLSGQNGPCREGKGACEGGKIVCKSDYTPKTEICANGIDDDCDGTTDRSSSCGCPTPGAKRDCYTKDQNTRKVGTCSDGKQTCQPNQQWGPCVGEVGPSLEVCDGKDNNCDGKTDEGNPGGGGFCKVEKQLGPCEAGELSCQAGKLDCVQKVQPKPKEDCGNNVDDDCDGEVDESPPCLCKPGTTSDCYTGSTGCKWNGKKFECNGICSPGTKSCRQNQTWSACQKEKGPEKEICDNKDNDCNGKTDDKTPGDGDSCTVSGQNGPCANGKKQCVKGVSRCTQVVKPKPKEVCGNGVDDNCNGKIDESPPCTCTVGQKRDCYSASSGCKSDGNNPPKFKCFGICTTGIQLCEKGPKWGKCIGGTGPSSSETCDGKDNDCDGKTDEGVINAGQPCFVPKQKGPCERGEQSCVGGKMLCKQTVLPKKEACNNKDDDCNGKVDDNLTRKCYGGTKGTAGKGECKEGSQQCVNGAWGSCNGEVRDKTETCNGKDDDCDGQADEGNPCPTGKNCSATTKTCVDKPSSTLAELKSPTPGSKLTGTSITFVWNNTGGEAYYLEIGSKKGGTNYYKKDLGKATFVTVKGLPDRGQTLYVRLWTKLKVGGWGTSNFRDYTFTAFCKSSAETCDGIDNDCDGKVDNNAGTSSALVENCYSKPTGCTKKTDGTYTCTGACKSGKRTCTNKKWSTCVGEQGPVTEVPGNKIDEDCDGKDAPVIPGCKSGKDSQRWASGNMVGCDCTGSKCVVTPKAAPGMCAVGWKVCELNQWNARRGTTLSGTFRWVAAKITCKPGTGSFCPGGTPPFSVTTNAKICNESCKIGPKRYRSALMVGPSIRDCSSWASWKTAKDNGNLGRGTAPYAYNDDKECMDGKRGPKHLGDADLASGVLCCK